MATYGTVGYVKNRMYYGGTVFAISSNEDAIRDAFDLYLYIIKFGPASFAEEMNKIPNGLQNSNDIMCDAIYDCITDDNLDSYKNWDIPYKRLARSYDEAIQEMVDYDEVDNKRKIEILFYQDTYRR